MPNLKNIDAAYLNTPFDPNNKYSVPYAIVDHDARLQRREDEGAGPPVDSWAAIFDPKTWRRSRAASPCSTAPASFSPRRSSTSATRSTTSIPSTGRSGRPDQEGEAVLGGVQRLLLHQGADRRQHLARARLLERHLPGEPRRAGRRAASSGSCRGCPRKGPCWRSTTW